MVGTSTQFTSERAPCGRTVNGHHHREADDEGLVIYDQHYDCGCRRIRHEYHDGSCHTRVVRHDGKVVDEGSDHGC